MSIQSITRYIPRARYVVPALLLLLLCFQLLDIHSTLTASSDRHEINQAINWLTPYIGFKAAVFLIKACSTLWILFIYRVWRLSNGIHAREFIICLALLNVYYGFVLANNYLP